MSTGPPHTPSSTDGTDTTDYFTKWSITPEELNALLAANNSLRGMVKGYLAEQMLRERYIDPHPDIDQVQNPDCHDRSLKCDWLVWFDGTPIRIEVKSLQSNSVTTGNQTLTGGRACHGQAQVDASDSRDVELPNGNTVHTTELVAGEFDILAVCLFAFTGDWDFAFALNEDLPRSTDQSLAPEDRQHLLKGSIEMSLPLDEPFTDELEPLLETVADEREATGLGRY